MTIGSFTSVSMDPPLVAFFPMVGSASFLRIAEMGVFCVNILARSQEELCRRFASRIPDKFHGVSHRRSPLGSPILDGVVAWIDCTISNTHSAGDHLAVFGSVQALAVERAAAPLMFFQGGYGGFNALSIVAEAEDDLAAQLRLADLARPHLEAVSRRFGVEAHATAMAGDCLIQLAWAGASGGRYQGNKVGLRLPAVPPMGLLFVAWEDERSREAWVRGGHPSADGELCAAYAEQCARVRDQGWQAIPDHDGLRRVEDTVVRMATSGQTPGLQRELAAHLEEYGREYVALTRAGADRPSGVCAPVFDRRGRVALALMTQSLAGLAEAEIEACRTDLVAAAADLTAAIRGVAPGGPDDDTTPSAH